MQDPRVREGMRVPSMLVLEIRVLRRGLDGGTSDAGEEVFARRKVLTWVPQVGRGMRNSESP